MAFICLTMSELQNAANNQNCQKFWLINCWKKQISHTSARMVLRDLLSLLFAADITNKVVKTNIINLIVSQFIKKNFLFKENTV